MLEFTLVEKTILIILILIVLWLFVQSIINLCKIINRGKGNLNTKKIGHRLISVIFRDLIFMKTTWRTRFWTDLFHLMIVWGFILYLPVNFLDIFKQVFPEISVRSSIGNALETFVDIFSVLIIFSIIYFLFRRFLSRKTPARIRSDILLHPKALKGMQRDSIIVAVLILTHVGGRLLGKSFFILNQPSSAWQPAAEFISEVWRYGSTSSFGWHIASWFSIVALLVFIPYFIHSKHIHLFFAPINHLLSPNKNSLSKQESIDFEDENLEIFGSLHLEDLRKKSILDAYACIMCFRCQDICPPYLTGKQLSPAALEVNKRYYLNENLEFFIKSQEQSALITDYAITEEAIWACTACGACVDICPVGVDPLSDILEIRRGLVLMEDRFPKPFQLLFRNLERTANPWGINPSERMNWTKGLNVPIIDEVPDPEILWWVGCAGAFDSKAQNTSRAFAKILNKIGVKFAILGEQENCTGDAARRAGREDIFMELTISNVELLNRINPKKIVTTCPHCLNTIKNEYPDFGGEFNVLHHSQYLADLVKDNRIGNLNNAKQNILNLKIHDPCYLSRFNSPETSISALLTSIGDYPVTIQKSGKNTFCCGGGGAQMWKEEESGRLSVNQARLEQLSISSKECLITACPFCKTRLQDAAIASGSELYISDLAERFLEQITEENI